MVAVRIFRDRLISNSVRSFYCSIKITFLFSISEKIAINLCTGASKGCDGGAIWTSLGARGDLSRSRVAPVAIFQRGWIAFPGPEGFFNSWMRFCRLISWVGGRDDAGLACGALVYRLFVSGSVALAGLTNPNFFSTFDLEIPSRQKDPKAETVDIQNGIGIHSLHQFSSYI